MALSCVRCAEALLKDARFCPSCGERVGALSDLATMGSPAQPSPERASGRPPSSSDSGSLGELGFSPGQIFAGRYRILALLGRGGMGEVYRADDLKLGQPVALKFPSLRLSQDEDLRQRFYAEVRLARQVSHPNVCRVYDVGEEDGRHYLSMEYVDGEDLASLLKRIGRLASDKAIYIARELCAGLAAAHERGVVHRDLKPANIMLDGRGHARITDFGLAIPEEMGAAQRGRAGTPTYMAPEQLTGGAITPRTDIYALGLILYEVFTGKRPFEAKTTSERLRLMESSHPESVTGIAGTDPGVERAILRCLEHDVAKRPASALAVAAALPGGDPLAAALAAGETPSPEMVAAAGVQGALRPAVAIACLATLLAGLLGAAALSSRTTLMAMAPLDKPREVLIARAKAIVESAGYKERPADTTANWTLDTDHLDHVEKTDKSAHRWNLVSQAEPRVVRFLYRQSPRPLTSITYNRRVGTNDPPFIVSGMVNVVVDSAGRLISFRAVAPQYVDAKEPAPDADFAPLFAAAGLDPAKFQATQPNWVDVLSTDKLVAWEGVWPDAPDVKVRVEAGSHRGKPVLFSVVMPWQAAGRMGTGISAAAPPLVLIIMWTVTLVAVLLVAAFLARRNLRLGRGDRSGGMKLAAFCFAAGMARWFFRTDHSPDLLAGPGGGELQLFFEAAGSSLFIGALLWLLYMGLEPYVRRRWPQMLISWNRLLAGDVRDPLVGRDLLIGGLLGLAAFSLYRLLIAAPPWFDVAGLRPVTITVNFNETRLLLAQFLGAPVDALIGTLYPLFVLLLLRLLLRKQGLAIAGLVLFMATNALRGNPVSAFDHVLVPLEAGLSAFVLVRLGVLCFAAFQLFLLLLNSCPLTLDFSAWYSTQSALVLLVLAAIGAYGFYTSLGGQKLLSGALLEEESP